MKKFTYYKIIQIRSAQGWEDSYHHEVSGSWGFISAESRQQFNEVLNSYKNNHSGLLRVISRKEPNQ